jgi:hypothetical protein
MPHDRIPLVDYLVLGAEPRLRIGPAGQQMVLNYLGTRVLGLPGRY